MAHETFRFLLQDEIPAIVAVEPAKRAGVDVVEPVIVEISGAGTAKLLLKHEFSVLFFFDHVGGQLGGEGETVARVARDERLVGEFLAFAAAIHPRGVKIRESLREE